MGCDLSVWAALQKLMANAVEFRLVLPSAKAEAARATALVILAASRGEVLG